jgi:hypothetical protein
VTPFPINFQKLAQSGGNPALGGYPYSIKGIDLMKNFVYAALDAEDDLIEIVSGQEGHEQRKLKISAGDQGNEILYWSGSKYVPLSAPPSSGTYVLGSTGGVLSWIETESCDE